MTDIPDADRIGRFLDQATKGMRNRIGRPLPVAWQDIVKADLTRLSDGWGLPAIAVTLVKAYGERHAPTDFHVKVGWPELTVSLEFMAADRGADGIDP